MNLEYGYTKYQNEIGRDGAEYRLAVRVRLLDGRVLGIRIDEVA